MGRAEQIERRRQRGRSESYEIAAQGDHPVWSRFSVQGPSGHGYEVILWNLDAAIYHCNCPDFATNGLGTCKHVESVLHLLESDFPDDLKQARDEGRPDQVLVYLDTTVSPPRVRLRENGKTDQAAHGVVSQTFGKEGALPQTKIQDFAGFVEAAAELPIQVTPEAVAHVERLCHQQALAETIESATGEFERFKNAVLDRKRGKAPSQDDVLTEFAERFSDLEDWELEGAAHLLGQGRAVLADDPELNKLPETLAACEFLRLTGRAPNILLITAASRRHLWRAAINRYCGVEPRIIGGTTFEELARADAAAPYAIVSYNRLYRNLDKLQSTQWAGLVLDEVQRVKSWPAPTGRAIKSFETDYAFVLTSSRLERRPQAFFYTMQLLDPYLLGPAWQFMDQHVVRDGRGAAIGAQKMDEALEACRAHWLRRRRQEVSLGSEPHQLELLVDVTHFQHRQLDPVLRTLLAMTRVQQVWSKNEREEVVKLLGQLRTVCTAPELIKPEHPGSPKLDELCHLVEDLCRDTTRRITVFCRQDDVAQAIARRLAQTGIEILTLTADNALADRQAALKTLTERDASTVLVLSDAAAEDLDLAGLSQVVIHAELPWCPETLARRRQRLDQSPDTGCKLEVNLLCASTPDAAAADALRRRGEQMAQILTDPARELDALAEAEEWQLRELISLVVDERMVLRPKKALLAGKPVSTGSRPFTLRSLKAKERNRRGQSPQQRYLVGEKRDEPSAPMRRAPSRPERAAPLRATRSSRTPPAAQASRATQAAGDVLVLGLETREDRITCNQPSKIHTLGLAMAVTYSFRSGSFTAWRAEYINDLVRTLLSAKLVVGYNPYGFEYKILGPYTGRNLSQIPTVDLLLEITKTLGQKVPFDLITAPTLDRSWTGDRSQASTFFKTGQVRELATVCTEGVKIVRDLFLYGIRNGEIHYQSSPTDERHALQLDLKKRLDTQAMRLVGLR